jgi:hypothetical protein
LEGDRAGDIGYRAASCSGSGFTKIMLYLGPAALLIPNQTGILLQSPLVNKNLDY